MVRSQLIELEIIESKYVFYYEGRFSPDGSEKTHWKRLSGLKKLTLRGCGHEAIYDLAHEDRTFIDDGKMLNLVLRTVLTNLEEIFIERSESLAGNTITSFLNCKKLTIENCWRVDADSIGTLSQLTSLRWVPDFRQLATGHPRGFDELSYLPLSKLWNLTSLDFTAFHEHDRSIFADISDYFRHKDEKMTLRKVLVNLNEISRHSLDR